MSDYICPYNCSYRTNSGFCGYTGGYDACQYRQLNHEENTVVGYVPPLKRTNADLIRAMSDEELAEYLDGVCHDLWQMFVKDPKKMWLDWLRQEAQP